MTSLTSRIDVSLNQMWLHPLLLAQATDSSQHNHRMSSLVLNAASPRSAGISRVEIGKRGRKENKGIILLADE